MPGLGTTFFRASRLFVDGRGKPGHDAAEALVSHAPAGAVVLGSRTGAPPIRGGRARTPGDYRAAWL